VPDGKIKFSTVSEYLAIRMIQHREKDSVDTPIGFVTTKTKTG
jgi:hypothetical protein